MSATQLALKDRNLLLTEFSPSDTSERYHAYIATETLAGLERLKAQHAEAYAKFPQFEVILQRFQNGAELRSPADSISFLEDISSFRNEAQRFMIDYYRRSTCERFGLSDDEYVALGRSAIDLNKQLRHLFAKEYAVCDQYDLSELATTINSVLGLNALREVAVERNRIHGLSVQVQIRSAAGKTIRLDGAIMEDMLCDDTNQSAPLSVLAFAGRTIEVEVDAESFKVRPFSGPFHEISTILSAAREWKNTQQL